MSSIPSNPSKASKSITYRASRLFALLALLLPLLSGCGVGDDSGERLGEYIVGTWQRGWGEGDVIIEGSPGEDDPDGPIWTPDRFTYDKFIFKDDGTYNGMMRSGSFLVLGIEKDTVFTGSYKCDNGTLRMDFVNQDGMRGTIIALVRSFTEKTVVISYEAEEVASGLRVQFILRKEE